MHPAYTAAGVTAVAAAALIGVLRPRLQPVVVAVADQPTLHSDLVDTTDAQRLH